VTSPINVALIYATSHVLRIGRPRRPACCDGRALFSCRCQRSCASVMRPPPPPEPAPISRLYATPAPTWPRPPVSRVEWDGAPLEQLDEHDPRLAASRVEIQKWAATCTLAREPEMPPGLHNRAADNWRVLLAIADDLGHSRSCADV
jgi:Protein of unknown function (DUF3631)